MQIQEALVLFVGQLEADGRSPHTSNQYRRHVAALAAWLQRSGRSTDLGALDHRDLAAFLVDPAARDRPDGNRKKATSVNALRSTLRTLFGFLNDGGFLPSNPARLLRRARCAPPPPRALTDDEAGKLLAVLWAADGRVAARDRALVVLLLGAGLRLGAALGLDIEDLDLDRGEAEIRRDKNDRRETAPLPGEVVTVLREFVGERQSGPLFLGRGGGRLSTRNFQRQFAGWLRKAGIERRLSPHSCRHTFATALLARTGDLRLVQRALRHRSVISTTVYAAANDREVRRAMEMPQQLLRVMRC